jgi:crotonobetainyl-CoA:carnitine CoA-transferase CaiB-like acyl-CoA transferase
MFNAHARNKLSMTVDVSHPEGHAIVRRLVTMSDVIIENNSLNVMARLGLDYDTVRAWKADIIYVAMPGFGCLVPIVPFKGLAATSKRCVVSLQCVAMTPRTGP